MDEFMDKVKKCLGLKAHYHVQGFYFIFFFLANHSNSFYFFRIREIVARQKKHLQILLRLPHFEVARGEGVSVGAIPLGGNSKSSASPSPDGLCRRDVSRQQPRALQRL